MERCPHCKAPIYGDLPWNLINNDLVHKDGGLSLTMPTREAIILEWFLRAYPNSVRTDTMIFRLWAERNLEEPENADNMIKVYVHRLRKLLKPINLTIRTLFCGQYVLEKVDG